MHDDFREMKDRLRKLDQLLVGASRAQFSEHVAFAVAVSQARRLVHRSNRSARPSAELKLAVERAETLATAAAVRIP
jgi:hypothetical protein